MSCAIIVHGPIGSGKTKTCIDLVERSRAEGVPLGGVLSPRVFLDGELIGYDCLDPASGETFPLVRLRGRADGPDWFLFGLLKYAFYTPGLERANQILTSSARSLSRPTLVFVDEFGRLEKTRRGLHPGAKRVSEALSEGGVAVFTCRTALVNAVKKLIRGNAQEVFEQKPDDVDAIWRLIRKALGSLGLRFEIVVRLLIKGLLDGVRMEYSKIMEHLLGGEGHLVEGSSFMRTDALGKAPSRAWLTVDYVPRGTAVVKVVRSTQPHAFITRRDEAGTIKKPARPDSTDLATLS